MAYNLMQELQHQMKYLIFFNNITLFHLAHQFGASNNQFGTRLRGFRLYCWGSGFFKESL